MSELQRVLERVRQSRAARALAPPSGRTAESTGAGAGVNGFAPGVKAFDLITGETGEVIARTTENIVVPAAQRANG